MFTDLDITTNHPVSMEDYKNLELESDGNSSTDVTKPDVTDGTTELSSESEIPMSDVSETDNSSVPDKSVTVEIGQVISSVQNPFMNSVTNKSPVETGVHPTVLVTETDVNV